MSTVHQFTKSEIDPILSDIGTLYAAGLYYAAIQVALTIPDICSSLETRTDERLRYKIEERYVGWCERYLEPKFSMFTAKDCWALRGGVIHNGKLFGHPKCRYDRVIFQMPRGDGTIIDEHLSVNDSGSGLSGLTLNIKRFCERMLQAACEWHRAKGSEELVRANLEGLIRFRPDGMKPFIAGTAVIA